MIRKKINRFSWLLIFLYIFLIQSGYTDADIFAERIITENKFSVITLDFTTRSTFNQDSIKDLFRSFDFIPGGFDISAIRMVNEDSKQFKYYIKTVKTGGDDFFCEELKLKILSENFRVIYEGSLSNLDIISELKNNSENWLFFVSLDNNSDSFKNKRCEFYFDFKTFRNSPNEIGGIYAQRKINNIISSGNW